MLQVLTVGVKIKLTNSHFAVNSHQIMIQCFALSVNESHALNDNTSTIITRTVSGITDSIRINCISDNHFL